MRVGGAKPLLLLVGLLGACSASLQWSHSVQLSPNYTLSWSPDEQSISFRVEVRTLGFVGLGFSPNGGMTHADIIMVWVDDSTGQAHIGDYYANHNGIPRRDEQQDVELLGAEQNGTHTIARFRRKWRTCDQYYDMALGEDTVRLIWAYGLKDPSDGVDPVTMHAKQARGTKSVYLKAKVNAKKKKTMHAKGAVRHWDVKMSNLSIPDNMDTRYWCKIFKLPPLGRKHHMIGYTPLLDSRNKGAVHHMILYECVHSRAHQIFARYVAHEGAACYSPKMPVDWENCLTPIVAWAVGSEGEFLPDHVGLPLSDTLNPQHDTFFMLEVHYDNPTFKNSRDSSGIRVHFTEELRQYDGGVMTVGIAVTPLHLIPPQQAQYATAGYCTDECTSKMLPDTGIKAVSVVLHSHLAGRNMRLRHIRNGKELEPIVEDSKYDFNYQQARVLTEEVSILQGDELIMECGYETINRTEPTYGGYSTKEEMCLAFLLHYPQTALAGCYSMTPVKSFFSILGVKEFYNTDMANIEKLLLHTRDEENIWRPKPSPVTPPAPGTPFPDFPFEGGHIDDEANQKAIMALKNMKQFTIEPVDGAGDAAGIFDELIIRRPLEFQNKTFLAHLVELPWMETLLTQRIEESFYKGQHLTFCRRKDDALAFMPKIRSFPNITTHYQRPAPVRDVNCPVRRGTQLGRYSPSSGPRLQPASALALLGLLAAALLH